MKNKVDKRLIHHIYYSNITCLFYQTNYRNFIDKILDKVVKCIIEY